MAHPAFYSNENLYTKEEYNKHIENGYLTDEDGQGHWVVNGKKLRMKLKPNINPTKQGVRIQFKLAESESEMDSSEMEKRHSIL